MGSIDRFLPWAPPRTNSLCVSDTPPLSLSLLICESRGVGHRSPEASSRSEVFWLLPDPYHLLLELSGTTLTCSSGLFPRI